MVLVLAQAAQVAKAPSSEAVVHNAFEALQLKIDSWISGFYLLLPNIITGLIVGLFFLAFAFVASILARRVLLSAERRDLGHVLGSFVFWSVLLLGSLVVLTIILPSMQPVDIFTSLGIGSVAIGFAFKDLLQNWLAGFLILIRRPFHRGDQIRVGEIEGTIQAVETRATLVKTFGGRLVIVPNTEIYTRPVTVHTAYEARRVELVIPVGLEVDLEAAVEVFFRAVNQVDDVLNDPAPDVLPWEFSNNNVNILVRWWIKPQRTYEVRTRTAVVMAIKRACEEAGIGIPADTKISFAETPLLVTQAKQSSKPKEVSAPPLAAGTAPEEAMPSANERRNPEAEKPKSGELNEGTDEIPR